jgi:polyglycine hydrolase-like protein
MHRTRGELGKTTTTASFLPYWRSMHKWPMIVVALLVLVFAVAGQAKAEVLFAAVWEQAGGPAFQARHNLTAAQFQQTFDQLVGQGFRPRAISGYAVGGEPRFAAIWEQAGGPAFQARHNLTAAQFQQTFDQLVGQGFRLRAISGYAVGGEPRFAAIWEQGGGPAFQARHNLTAAQFQQTFDQLVGQGFRLRAISGYAVSGEPHFAAIWEQDGGPAFQARHNLTAAQYQQTFSQLVGQGFRLKHVDGYTVGGVPRFAAIWEQDGGPAFQARHNLTAAQFQQTFDQLVGQGFRLRAVSGYEVPAIRPSPPNFTCAVCKNGSCQCGSQTQSQLCANHGGVDPTLGCIQQE